MRPDAWIGSTLAWWQAHVPDTAGIQIGLWLVVGLSLVYAAWEYHRRQRRFQANSEAALISLPGGEIPPGTRTRLEDRAMIIGRALEADVRLAFQSIALRHAAVVPEQGNFWLKDLGSRTGVRVNGVRLDRSIALRNGDLVEVAEQPFRFHQEQAAAWQPFLWIWFLLGLSSILFVGIQWAAWGVSGAGRPPAATVNMWSLGLAIGAWAAMLIVRKRRIVLDPVLLPAALTLFGLGLAVVLRTQPELYVRQAVAGALGLGALVLAAVLPLQALGRYRYLSLVAGLGLLVATLFVGNDVGGQRLAVSLFGFQFQPAEPAKLFLAVFLAGILSERQELVARSGRSWSLTRSDVRYVGPMVLALAVALGLLVIQRDLGTALLFFGLFVAFLGMGSGRVIFVLVSLGAFGFGAFLSAAAFGRVRERVSLWLDPWQDPQGLGYQLSQGLFALAAGGVQGVGLGRGFPNLIPAGHTDLPMAIIGEELGLLGTLGVLTLLGTIIFRGYRAARRADDDFLGLLAAGLTTVVALQTLVIVGGLVRLLPLTGVTLPFVSYGGTSLVVNMALIGVLLGVSGSAAQPLSISSRRQTRFSWKRQMRWLMGTVVVGFIALGVLLVRWQVREARELTQHPNNPRLAIIAPKINRGKILSADNVPIVTSVKKGDRYYREIPTGGLLSGIIGYSSQRHGKTGVEGEANSELQGMRHYGSVAEALDRAQNQLPGDNVQLTIHMALQQKAAEALGDRKGSIVALNPETGAILAIVSNPRHPLNRVDENWAALVSDPRKPLFFPATRGVYPPGSTFKVVTAAVALNNGLVTPQTRFYCGGAASVGNYTWRCYGGTSHGNLTFADALRLSCNVTFGKVGLQLGKERLIAGAKRLGIGTAPPMSVETSAGLLDPYNEKWASVPAQIGFGQGPLAATPLQMALVASAIANDGTIMKPYVIQSYRTPEGQEYARTQPEPWIKSVRPDAARAVREMMANVVKSGTGGRAQIPGLEVGGKTGTAENPHGEDHAWFISLAPVRDPKIAVAVIAEGGGLGGRVAAPIAREVIAAYFRKGTEGGRVASR